MASELAERREGSTGDPADHSGCHPDAGASLFKDLQKEDLRNDI